MQTLQYWKSRLTSVPSTIECPEMQLFSGSDHEPPIFVGPGHIDIRSSTAIDFTMFALAADGSDVFRRLVRAKENPYEIFDQFRLEATDYEGHKWAGGWTSPHLKGYPKVGWPLAGQINSLSTQASGPWVSNESGVELAFYPKLPLSMDKQMISVVSVGDEEIEKRFSDGQQTVKVLDSEIKFFHLPSEDFLWVTAKTTDKLQHPYLENWIAEPLRILLGQLIYPRLVARNFGNGTAQVWLRPSPRLSRDSAIAALVEGNPFRNEAKFWELYARLLVLIAEARDETGHPNFEAHRITSFYEEIAQATQGSRWVLCLTLASTAEGIAKMLMQPEDQASAFDKNEIDSIKDHIEAWKGNKVLRGQILGSVGYASKRSIGKYLKDLVQRGVLEVSAERAWSSVRNVVMHENLISPWATKEEDERLRDLARLVHQLTHELIRGQNSQSLG